MQAQKSIDFLHLYLDRSPIYIIWESYKTQMYEPCLQPVYHCFEKTICFFYWSHFQFLRFVLLIYKICELKNVVLQLSSVIYFTIKFNSVTWLVQNFNLETLPYCTLGVLLLSMLSFTISSPFPQYSYD